jgi:hypothetical protein
VVSYARKYITLLSWSDGLEYLRRYLSASFKSTVGFRLLALIGLLLSLRNARVQKQALFLYALLLASFGAAAVGLFFRPHYFILTLPAMAILAGFGVSALREFLSGRKAPAVVCALPLGLFVLVLSGAVYAQRGPLFQYSPDKIIETNYPENPFLEAQAVAEYIKSHSADNDTLAVIGSEPEIYFYAGRRSATGYIYTYGLMEPQPYALQMQQGMIREIESRKPAYLVFVEYENSWAPFPNSDRTIFKWFAAYSQQGYDLVGVVNRFPSGKLVSRWDAQASAASLPRQFFLSVYKRKSGI